MLSLQAAALGRTALRRTTLFARPVSASWPSCAAARTLSSFPPLPRPLGRAKLSLVVPMSRRETSNRAKTADPAGKPQPPTNAAAGEATRIPTSSVPPSPSPSPGAAVGPLADPTLHEDIYTLPNILTMSRLAAAPVIGYFVLHDAHAWAVGLLAYAGVTDLLDGWIARRWNRKTVVGTVIDPMADKVLMTVLTVCLAVKGALPVWVASIILGRDVGLAIAAIYFRWISLPPPKTFARYWDFSLPSAEVRPTTISKYNTFLQLALVGVTTAAPLVPLDLSQALTIMQYVVAATTIWSGASYVYTKDAVKILNAPRKQKTKQ